MNVRKWFYNLTWKTKKHVASAMCFLVMLVSLVIALYEPGSSSMESGNEKRESFVSADTNSVQIAMRSAKVDAAESTQKEESVSGKAATKEEVLEPQKDATADEVLQPQNEGTKASGFNNRVVEGSAETDKAVTNKVVANEVEEAKAPLTLVSSVLENHGYVPQEVTADTLFQYPVELGYAVDKNYDGRQKKSDTILKMVLDVTQETTEENSTEEEKEKTEEEKQREKFRDDVVTRIFETQPVEGHSEESAGSITKIVKSEEDIEETEDPVPEEMQDASAEEDTEAAQGDEQTSESVKKTSGKGESINEANVENVDSQDAEESVVEETEEVQPQPLITQEEVRERTETVSVDAGSYIVKGKLRNGYSAYVSDVELRPLGLNGFDRIRMGTEGEFSDALVLTEDTPERMIDLYFSNGVDVTDGTTFTYAKDTVKPVMKVNEEDLKILESDIGKIYCTKEKEAKVIIEDGENSSGIARIASVYGDQISYVLGEFEDPKITLPENFFGRVLFNCADNAGNVADFVSQYYLIENTAPSITLHDSEVCTAPYVLGVSVEDQGHIVSGIDDIRCKVNGKPYDIEDLSGTEYLCLTEDIQIASKSDFALNFDEEGSYDIQITAIDNAGNETTISKTIEVTKPELVGVYMPKQFTIHIDPQQLAGREQIYSDEIELNNVSNVDVKVTIENIKVTVQDGMSDTGVLKDCELYLVAPDTGEKISLAKGENEQIYSFKMPLDAEEGYGNLYFVGTMSEGSERMWSGDDISIDVSLSFTKWEEK